MEAFQPRVDTKKVDSRRSKDYGRLVNVHFSFIRAESDPSEIQEQIGKAVRGALPPSFQLRSVAGKVYRNGRQAVDLKIKWPVDKPSDIPSEEDVLAQLDIPGLQGTVAGLLGKLETKPPPSKAQPKKTKAKKASRVKEKTSTDVRHPKVKVTDLSEHKDVIENAKRACRYNQRLAALNAELRAEIEAKLSEKGKSTNWTLDKIFSNYGLQAPV